MSQQEPRSDPPACPGGAIVAENTPDGVVFRPSPRRAHRTLGGLVAFAVAFPVVLAATVLVFEPPASRGAELALVGFGLLVSGVVAAAVVRNRSSVPVPLIAESCGRVRYGPQVLLDAGAAPRLYVEEQWHDAEGGSWATFRVVASNRWGPVVHFPAPWFESFDDRAVAVWFAHRLAAAIGAKVRDPDSDIAPGPAGA